MRDSRFVEFQKLYEHEDDDDVGVARGCSGCTCTPRAEKNL